MITGAEIKAARKRAGLSQAELAKRVHVSQRTIGGWERDENVPGIAEPRLLAVLREYLGADEGWSRLQDVADVELLAEIARRFARRPAQRAEERGTADIVPIERTVADVLAAQRRAADERREAPAEVAGLPPDGDLDDLEPEADEAMPRGGGRRADEAARDKDHR